VELKEYSLENDREVELTKLEAGLMPIADYTNAHGSLVVPCHDIYIQHGNGLLLVIRDNLPMKGILWPMGGRITRGLRTEESLARRVKGECGLELSDIKYLGSARLFMSTEPLGHEKGTDNIALVYYAKGHGELKLDDLHKDPKIVTPVEYPKLRPQLHPYVQDFMDIAIKLVD